MQQKFIVKENRKRLLLFFAGWGMDETPFEQWRPEESDLLICYDYRSMAFDARLLQDYSCISLIAWSMGVWAASQVMRQGLGAEVGYRIAINGTPYPIDEARGISPAIFEGTLQGLNERTLQKFQRRMCRSGADYEAFRSVAPRRSAEELKEELAAIHHHFHTLPTAVGCWDKAIVGTADLIFLPHCQQNAWQQANVPFETVDEAHFFDFLNAGGNVCEPINPCFTS